MRRVLAGAGKLAASVWKIDHKEHSGQYRFSVFNFLRNGGVAQRFSTADLIQFVKLTQVLASVMTDDGCLKPRDRRMLTELRDVLDQAVRLLAAEPEAIVLEEERKLG